MYPERVMGSQMIATKHSRMLDDWNYKSLSYYRITNFVFWKVVDIIIKCGDDMMFIIGNCFEIIFNSIDLWGSVS